MTLASRIKSWLGHFLGRTRSESEMANELRFHVDAHAEDLMRCGVPQPEAARRARIAFGAMENIKEECRDARGTNFTENFFADRRCSIATG